MLGILLGVTVCCLAEGDAPVDTAVGVSSTGGSDTVALDSTSSSDPVTVEVAEDSGDSSNIYQDDPKPDDDVHQDESEEEQCTNPDASATGDDTQDDNTDTNIDTTTSSYHHLVVLVHGYMGSEREQAYLGEALMHQSKLILQKQQEEEQCDISNAESAFTCNNNVNGTNHNFVVMRSKANAQKTMDGVAKGGERLAQEVYDWMQEQAALIQRTQGQKKPVMTLSLVSNSLGGLYSRYAVAELQDLVAQQQENHQTAALPFQFQPLLFCTTSSPHLGISRETFIRLPAMAEVLLAKVMQQTGADLLGVDSPLVTTHMCSTNSSTNNNNVLDNRSGNRYLQALSQFQKRIAVANAYNTDFLVSVTSGAFLSSSNSTNGDGHSPHFVMTHNHTPPHPHATPNHRKRQHRLMKNKHVALQVVTAEQQHHGSSTGDADSPASEDDKHNECARALDSLGWHKIFLDTRDVFPAWSVLSTPTLSSTKSSFSSHELREHFSRYGTLLPFAHPINMANAKTDWYRELTKLGRPIMDSLAELLILDMIELSTAIAP